MVLTLGAPERVTAQAPVGWEWRAGLEVGPRPALVGRWETFLGGWSAGGGVGIGPGEDPVRIRAMPHLRLGRAVGRRLWLAAGLGLDWARMGGGGNDEESEIQWEVGTGWRGPGALVVEGGLRWTDYATPRRAAFLRATVPFTQSARATKGGETGDGVPLPMGPSVPRDLGVPATASTGGRLALPVRVVDRQGSGVSFLAANPRGDPDPRVGGDAANVDRLAMGAELWGGSGHWQGWTRWRSDLHTDPSIEERTRLVAEERFFPTSVSFAAGGSWQPDAARGASVTVRHDPQTFLWMPHLASERTAVATAATASLRRDGVAGALDLRDLSAMEGRTVDPLRHVRGHLAAEVWPATHVGLEHERLELRGAVDGRTRLVLEHDAGLRVRAAVGSDVAVGAEGTLDVGAWEVGGRLGYRSDPEPLHFDALLARGWTTELGGSGAVDGAVWEGALRVGRDGLALKGHGVLGEPVWTPGGVVRADGGWTDLVWTDTGTFGRVEARARVTSWGPEHAWWREVPAASGSVEVWRVVGAARVRAWGMARSKIRSARTGMEEPAGAELGLGVDVPMPSGPIEGMMVRVALDDVFDQGVPIRPGAPHRGRRLTVVLTWRAPGDP